MSKTSDNQHPTPEPEELKDGELEQAAGGVTAISTGCFPPYPFPDPIETITTGPEPLPWPTPTVD